MKVLCNANKLKSTIWKKDIVHYVFKQDTFYRMSLEVHFCKWIFDLVVNLLRLDYPHFTFACSYSIARTWNISHLNIIACHACCRNQREALARIGSDDPAPESPLRSAAHAAASIRTRPISDIACSQMALKG